MSQLPETFVNGFHDIQNVKKMKYNNFGCTNIKVSNISLGTGGFSYFYGDYSIEECKEIVERALKSGINFIDTAPWYGHGTSEEILGQCLKNIPRKSYYIASKVGRYEADPKLMFNFSREKVLQSVETSLKRLGIDYLDLIQVHDIEFAPSLDVVINDTLPALQECLERGLVKHIGITGYPNSTLKECIEKSKIKIDSVLSYTRLTLIDQSLNEFIPFYKSNKLAVINAAVHSMGLLTNNGPQPWHPASQHIKQICSKVADYCKENNVELGKLALHFALKQSGQDTVLVGINSIKVLESNLDVYFNGLNEQESQIYEQVQKRFKEALKETHWEGVELQNFKEQKFNAFEKL